MNPDTIFDVLTIFPQMITDFSRFGIISRAIESGLINVRAHDIREFVLGNHKQVDDYPYGGGAGMVMKPEPVMNCVEHLKNEVLEAERKTRIILLSPQGILFDQDIAKELAKNDSLILVCGRYEGVDARVEENIATDVISIGDFILTGGEVAAMAIIEAISRLLPGVLGDEQSSLSESFEEGLLEYPQYTRPEEVEGMKVPPILLSGNHKKIEKWRRQQSILKTLNRRPDLLKKAKLTEDDSKFLSEITAAGE